MKKVYVKVSLVEDPDNSYIDTIEGAKAIIDSFDGGDYDEGYVFTPVYMTEQEFNNLPEFHGF